MGKDSAPAPHQAQPLSDTATSTFRRVFRKELLLLSVLLFFGIVLMPIAIYVVGDAIFGAYGGHGYGDFFATLSGKLRHGDGVAWFLVGAPYLVWQVFRLMAFAWRRTGKA